MTLLLIALGVVGIFTAVIAAFWVFAGFQYALLLCGLLFVCWLVKEFWPLIAYHMRGQR